MDKDFSKKIIKNTFENKFDRSRFAHFIVELLNLDSQVINEAYVSYNKEHIQGTYQPYIESFEKIASYEAEGDSLDILIVKLARQSSIERARTMQRNFIAWYLKGNCDGQQKDAALAAFVSPDERDWRFSLIRMDYSVNEDKKGAAKLVEQFSPAKRWSFLVGANEKSHTAQAQLIYIVSRDDRDIKISELEEAFSVEKVTKEFFTKYRELFFQTKDALDEIVGKDIKVKSDFESKNISTANFAKKLLGQIVFLYFLQKKGWFGVARDAEWGSGSKNFLRELSEGKHSKYNNFFNDLLEPLFYEALRYDRSHDDGYYSKFNCKIPFLNGGLFDPIGDYDWAQTDIKLPNYLFSNSEQTKEGDEGTGILDIFDRYNFTVQEDEPLEKEVAVDPEMLGKVFENLLEIKDRKSKGTYYTPREIVHSMCQQSLINYLSTELECKVKKEDMEVLIKYGGNIGEDVDSAEKLKLNIPPNISDNAIKIDEKLSNVKVCDPAVGSGAFLVGMMSEIIRTRNVLSKYMDKPIRGIYDLKRYCIENCLYGVDIDPGAVEICKLRLWLSLIVDEDNIRNIKPLPNLDYKIVCGNSLLNVEINLFNQEAFNKLEKIKPIYFSETNINKKYKYKSQIDELIFKITDGHEEFDFMVYFSEVFHEKSGFDIVIANPPYIGEKGHKDLFNEIKNYRLKKYYHGQMDIFYFFFHLAIDLSHKNSLITFITTNYYTTARGARKLRQDFRNRTTIKHLINFNELRIFESALGQHNMITILKKNTNPNALAKNLITKRTGLAKSETFNSILNWEDKLTNYYNVTQINLYDGIENYIRVMGIGGPGTNNPIQNILNKMQVSSTNLGELCNVNVGLYTGADKVTDSYLKKYSLKICKGTGIFIISPIEMASLKLNDFEKTKIVPFFKNSDIHQYYTNEKENQYLINISYPECKNYSLNNIPGLFDYISRFENVLKGRRSNDNGLQNVIKNGYWWSFTIRQIDFNQPKIVAPQRSLKNTFGYNEIPWYASADVYFITKKDESIFLKYILALLNSKLYYLWLYHRGKRKGEALELYQKPLSEIPIKRISEPIQRTFIKTVDEILSIINLNDNLNDIYKIKQMKEYENIINKMVYKLYELTPEEIEIVENFN